MIDPCFTWICVNFLPYFISFIIQSSHLAVFTLSISVCVTRKFSSNCTNLRNNEKKKQKNIQHFISLFFRILSYRDCSTLYPITICRCLGIENSILDLHYYRLNEAIQVAIKYDEDEQSKSIDYDCLPIYRLQIKEASGMLCRRAKKTNLDFYGTRLIYDTEVKR